MKTALPSKPQRMHCLVMSIFTLGKKNMVSSSSGVDDRCEENIWEKLEQNLSCKDKLTWQALEWQIYTLLCGVSWTSFE